jgi:hypothetical protein
LLLVAFSSSLSLSRRGHARSLAIFMSSDRQHLEQLVEELKLVEKAISPNVAAKSLRDYMDQHAVSFQPFFLFI